MVRINSRNKNNEGNWNIGDVDENEFPASFQNMSGCDTTVT